MKKVKFYIVFLLCIVFMLPTLYVYADEEAFDKEAYLASAEEFTEDVNDFYTVLETVIECANSYLDKGGSVKFDNYDFYKFTIYFLTIEHLQPYDVGVTSEDVITDASSLAANLLVSDEYTYSKYEEFIYPETKDKYVLLVANRIKKLTLTTHKLYELIDNPESNGDFCYLVRNGSPEKDAYNFYQDLYTKEIRRNYRLLKNIYRLNNLLPIELIIAVSI